MVLPALMIQIDAGNLMSAAGMADVVSQVVGSGATAVVLTETSGAGGNALFEAVVKLKEQLRGRAALLVVDRIDIVQAAGADGVLLTAQGEHARNCVVHCAAQLMLADHTSPPRRSHC